MKKKILVSDIMTKDVVFVTPETGILDVAKTIFENRFHALPVVEEGKLVGILTETDFFIKDEKNIFLPSYIDFLSESKAYEDFPENKKEKIEALLKIKAGDIMTKDVVTVMGEMKYRDVLYFFNKTGFISLPVVNEKDELEGIVTLSDVIGVISEEV